MITILPYKYRLIRNKLHGHNLAKSIRHFVTTVKYLEPAPQRDKFDATTHGFGL